MEGDQANLMVPVSVGELIDKITILELKSRRIRSAVKRANVERELALLRSVEAREIGNRETIAEHRDRLAEINARLWDVEEALRNHEAQGQFDDEFVALARSVYKLNDERGRAKREINMLLGSQLIEEKSHDAD